jgi:pimeloyl-ACP methyl ester carboxylesterase
MAGRSIVLVHGLFMTRACWAPWVQRYEALGHRCLAIEYPERERPVAELRARHPDAATARVELAQVLERHVEAIRALPQPPIVMGHSFGGLLTQLLLQRGLGACGVAIDSVPPAGLVSWELSFWRSMTPVLGPLLPASRPYLMSPAHFAYTFVNTLPAHEQRREYEAFVVPESRRLARAALSRAARVDYARARPPLLFIAGELDHIIPASLNRANAARYRRSPARTDFRQFPGRTHHILGQPGWEEVADFALAWALEHAGEDASRAAAVAGAGAGD